MIDMIETEYSRLLAGDNTGSAEVPAGPVAGGWVQPVPGGLNDITMTSQWVELSKFFQTKINTYI